MVPLLRWGKAPDRLQKRVLIASSAVLVGGLLTVSMFGKMHPLEILVIGLAAGTFMAVLIHLVIEVSRRSSGSLGRRIIDALVAPPKAIRRIHHSCRIHDGGGWNCRELSGNVAA